jgi:hypothetical protein
MRGGQGFGNHRCHGGGEAGCTAGLMHRLFHGENFTGGISLAEFQA